MVGVLLALGSAATWGCGDFLSGLMSRRLPLLSVLLATQAAGVPFVLVVALLGGPPDDWSFAALACLAALCGLCGLGALFHGMATGAMSVVAPISATSAAIPVLVGLFTGETPTVVQGLGVLVALTGVMLASRPAADEPGASAGQDITSAPLAKAPPAEAPRRALAAGAGYGLISAAGFGAFYVVIRAATAAAGGNPFWPGLVARTTGTLLMFAFVLVTRARVSLPARSAGTLVVAGGLDVTANVLYAAASVTDVGPLAAVISSLYPVTTIALARLFLNERLAPLQSAGVVASLAGVALIAWR